MRYLGPYSLKSTVEGIYRRTNNQFMPNPRIVIGDVVLRVSGEDFELIPDRDGNSVIEASIRDLCGDKIYRRGRPGRLLSAKAGQKRFDTVNGSWIFDGSVAGVYNGEVDAVF